MSVPQVQSPVDSATLSPVERTAAWVFNNGQYEDTKKDTAQNLDEIKHAEKVDLILCAASCGATECCAPHSEFRGTLGPCCHSITHSHTGYTGYSDH